METTSKTRTFAKLGYSHMDTAEIVLRLNKLIASYHVFFQKLRNFHWNITGQDFFDLHQKFGSMYEEAFENIDEIAEKIRLFGKFPFSTYKDILHHSEIMEPEDENLTSLEMVREILDDVRYILNLMEECVNTSQELGDYGTESMIKGYIRKLEKDHWMLTAWINEPTV